MQPIDALSPALSPARLASCRFVDSKAWQHYSTTGKMRWREFATGAGWLGLQGIMQSRLAVLFPSTGSLLSASILHPPPPPCHAPPTAAPKHANLWERLTDIASTLLGVVGLSDAVTDNASVNVFPLQDGSAVVMTETVQVCACPLRGACVLFTH